MSKECTYCGERKPLSEYDKVTTTRSGYTGRCKQCRREYMKNYTAANRAKVRTKTKEASTVYRAKHPDKIRERRIKCLYGITLKQYDVMLANQGGGCAICGRRPGVARNGRSLLSIDHCHKTGGVRGILCQPCNKGLGDFRDDVKTMESAIEYLKRHR